MLAHMARLPLVLLGLLTLLAAFLWIWSGSATPASDQIAMPGMAGASHSGSATTTAPAR